MAERFGQATNRREAEPGPQLHRGFVGRDDDVELHRLVAQLPRDLLRTWLANGLAELGLESVSHAIRDDRGREVVEFLSDTFDVNPVFAFLRLQELGFVPNVEQREIFHS